MPVTGRATSIGALLAGGEAHVVAQHGAGEAVGIADARRLRRPAAPRRASRRPARPPPARCERCSAAAPASGAARRSTHKRAALPLHRVDRDSRRRGWARNCVGGLTWNGRQASASVIGSVRVADVAHGVANDRLRARPARRRRTRRRRASRSPTRQCVAGIGRSPSRKEWPMRASAQLATRPSLTRNGSSAPTPGHRLDARHPRRAATRRVRRRRRRRSSTTARRRRRAGSAARRRAPAMRAKKAFASAGLRRARRPRGCVSASDAHGARLRIGEPVVLDVAARVLDVTHGAPRGAVVGELHVVARRDRPVRPAHRHGIELARLVGATACPAAA